MPIEAYENDAYRRVAKGLRNPRRIRDALLRISFLTLSFVLFYPILFVYINLRVPMALLTYSLIVLTTIVLYLLACDPLPPCAGKLTEWLRRSAPSRLAASESPSGRGDFPFSLRQRDRGGMETRHAPVGGFMRTPLPLVTLLFLALCAAGAIHAQITNPIPAPVVKRGLSVEIRDVVRLPDTRGLRPADQDVTPAGWARVSFVRDLPDGRRFANDSRGLLYLLDRNNQPSVYANVGAAFPLAVYNRLESGFIGFDFHPEFARNGLFYTVHGERATGNPATPNFIPPGFTPGRRDLPQRHHRVARDQPGGEHLRGHQARAAPRRPTSSTTSRTRSATSSSTRRRSPGRPTTACSTPAAAIWGSATAADRTRTIPARRSASTR